MTQREKQVILITGASSGIGKQTAQLLSEQGHIVYGAARRVDRIDTRWAKPLALDVTDDQQIHEAVQRIMEEQGRIDVLVNNAGYGSYGALEDVSIAEAKQQFDVNVFGLVALTREVIPVMRKQGSGRIINISSMGGRLTTYFGGWYHASKYALESLSDALRMEVKPFHIDVTLIEPGAIASQWSEIAAKHLEESSRHGAYAKEAARAAAGLRRVYANRLVSQPIIIARTIAKAVSARKPRARYLIGFGAKPLVFLHAILPARAFDALAMSM